MRIIGGTLGGRRFDPPKLSPTRPTTNIAKEGLFNIIVNNWDLEGTNMLDLFAGTGSISYEFASRGCPTITSVDKYGGCVDFIKKTIEDLDLTDTITVLRMDVFKFMSSTTDKYDLIFAGPPYPLLSLNTIPDKVFAHDLLKPGGWLIMEHNPDHNFDDHPHFLHRRNYGTTIFSIFNQKD